MNTLRKHLLISLAVIGFGATTVAAHAADDKPSPRMERQHDGAGKDGAAKDGPGKFAERMAERRAKQQAHLHDKLKITAAQEPAWAAFTTAMTPKAPFQRPDRDAFAKMTAPQRMEQHLALSKQRTAHQESRLAALKTFYAALTPEQKKVFDESVPGRGHGDHRGHGGHRGHGDHLGHDGHRGGPMGR